jgi:hypothetical protein
MKRVIILALKKSKIRKVRLFYCMLFISALSYGQTGNIDISVKFDNDRHTLRSDAQQTLDKTVDTLSLDRIVRVTLAGHTDSNADSMYNIRLSERRAVTVRDYLITKGVSAAIIQTGYFGRERPAASNASAAGRQQNRRVDAVFYSQPSSVQPSSNPKPEREKPEPEKPSEDLSQKDTVILLPNGTQAIFNLKEYLELANRLEIIEANKTQDIIDAGLKLISPDGNPLVSCGMIRIGLTEGSPDIECFKYPVKIKFPAPEKTDSSDCDYCKGRATVWVCDREGCREVKDDKVTIIKEGNRNYYLLEVKRPDTWINCDCSVEGWGTGASGMRAQGQIKIRRSYKIVSVRIMSGSPVAIFELKPDAKRKNTVKHGIPCWSGEKKIMATVVNKQGKTLYLTQRPLNNLPHKRKFSSNCSKTNSKDNRMYSKYVIKPAMLSEPGF